jgi:hypothetical protein
LDDLLLKYKDEIRDELSIFILANTSNNRINQSQDTTSIAAENGACRRKMAR